MHCFGTLGSRGFFFSDRYFAAFAALTRRKPPRRKKIFSPRRSVCASLTRRNIEISIRKKISSGTQGIVLEVPLCNLLTSICNFVPCNRVVQRANSRIVSVFLTDRNFDSRIAWAQLKESHVLSVSAEWGRILMFAVVLRVVLGCKAASTVPDLLTISCLTKVRTVQQHTSRMTTLVCLPTQI